MRFVAAITLFCKAMHQLPFFSLDSTRSSWWSDVGVSALYLSGMVVAKESRGCGVGGQIISWCINEAARRNCDVLRLDCHAGNSWLCHYYESQGFVKHGQVEQHPGYIGNLYQYPVR